jgi:hypothetical protein
MPMQRERYPTDWEAISLRIRAERAGWKCEWCGAEHGQPHPVTGSKVILTVAHLDHDPANCADDNLAALCQLEHLRYDAKHHAANAAATRRRSREQAGQLSLADYIKAGDKEGAAKKLAEVRTWIAEDMQSFAAEVD